MRIAMVGTRGVPAKYGGFETAVEEVGSRLVCMGHDVRVYCRGDDRSANFLGMQRVRFPALRHRSMETLSHTALSVAHLVRHRTDVAIVFNAANAPFVPLLKAARIPVALHVDGLEWKRAKWGPNGRRYYLANERLAVATADKLIADAVGIQDYYRARYSADSVFIPYGAPILEPCKVSLLEELGLTYRGFHLVVARIEPENHVDVVVRGYRDSSAGKPLVVVGSVPYPSEHEGLIRSMAAEDPRIRLLGSVWDQQLLDALYSGAASYLHGHSVGGTNPSLLRAMGAGAYTIAWDVTFNREVLGGHGDFFDSPKAVTELLEKSEQEPERTERVGEQARGRAADAYRWEEVAAAYDALCRSLL